MKMLRRTSGTKQRTCVCVLCGLSSCTHCVAGEWQKHPPSELFRRHDPEHWEGTLDNTREWITAHPRTTRKRKRSREVAPPPAAPVRVVPPVVEVETPPDADGAPLPELRDMLRDCEYIQRALTRLVGRIQQYIYVIEK